MPSGVDDYATIFGFEGNEVLSTMFEYWFITGDSQWKNDKQLEEIKGNEIRTRWLERKIYVQCERLASFRH
jgi:hypothetical protein